MSQKRITSFFKPKVPEHPVDDTNGVHSEDEAIAPRGRFKRPRVESDNEAIEADHPSKKPRMELDSKDGNPDGVRNRGESCLSKRELVTPSPSKNVDQHAEKFSITSPQPGTSNIGVRRRLTAKRLHGDTLRSGIMETLKAIAERGKSNQKPEASSEKSKPEDQSSASKEKVESTDTSHDDQCEKPTKDNVKISPSTKTNLHSFFSPKTKISTVEGSKNSGMQYDPTRLNYDPVKDALWMHSAKVPYLALAKTFDAIEHVSSRLKVIDILANYFRSVIVLSPDDLLPSVYLCLNRLAPAFEDLELGISEIAIIRAVAESTGRSYNHIKAEVAACGDLGIVAEKSRRKQNTMFKSAQLTVRGVFEKLRATAKISGKSTHLLKMGNVIHLFVMCESIEARYLIRSLSGKLRIGLAEQSLLQALAVACTKTPLLQEYPPKIIDASLNSADAYKKQVEKNALIIKTAYCEYPDYGRIIPALLEGGIDALPETCHLTPGVPLKPMLAHPTRGIQEIFQRFEGSLFTCEWKYDGERAQIHMTDDGVISVFSRNQENNTSKYPDIVSAMKKVVNSSVKSYILDCEAVAWDSLKQQILPFQILSTRKRKNASESEIKVQVCVFVFDLLMFNGQPLVKEPLATRRKLLRENFQVVEGEFQFAQSRDTNVIEEIQSFLDEAITGNCEGLMVKTLEEEATYEIARRSHKWLKLKKDYLEGIGDTIDVVVIGGYKGQGKRAGIYGGFLLAIYDPNGEEFQTLCKIGTGFSDDDLMKHNNFFKEHIIPEAKSYYRYDKSHTPDDWFDAVQVWEIKGADLTYSPAHCAAKGLCGGDARGISLRFPRFLRTRDDKPATEATTAEQIAEMFLNQAQVQSMGNSSTKNVEEDFY